MFMHFDPSNYVRLEDPHPIDTSSAGASFATSTGDLVEVMSYGPGVFRLRMGPHSKPDYGILVGKSKPCTVATQPSGLTTFTAGDATLEIGGGPLRFRLLWRGRPVAGSITDQHVRGYARLPTFGRIQQGGEWTAALALASGEAIYGLGEKFGPLDKRGQLVHSQVEDALGVNTGLAYKNTPFAWSAGIGRGAWGVFVHTPGRVAHGVGHPDWSHRSYALVVDDEALDLFLFAADEPSALLDIYAQLTGRAGEIPRWSLGLSVARVPCATAGDALAFARKLRERRIPCDAIALDGGTTWSLRTRFNFRFDAERFPDPQATFAALRAEHLRVCVWEYPYVSIHDPLFAQLFAGDGLLRNAYGDPCVLAWDAASTFPESGIVDFTNPAAYAWWRDAHQALFAAGVDAIECDFGEQVPEDAVAHNGDRGRRLHNAYPLLYNRCVVEATRKYAPGNGAPVVFGRAAWSGQQRYPLGWGGEPQSDWEGLAASIRGGLSWGMSGHPFHASDIGGAYGTEPPSAELFVRWLQAAVFASHMRLDGSGERAPWAFGGEAEGVARKWLAFRYRLIPYLEHAIRQAVATGMPVMRAMPLAFPANALTLRYETQFMCGDALLCAPILASGGEVEVALPPGGWYDLNSRKRFAGRQVLKYKAALDQFPVFGREGRVLPLGRAVQHTGEIDDARPLDQVWIFGRPDATLELPGLAVALPDGAPVVRCAGGVQTHFFGETCPVERL